MIATGYEELTFEELFRFNKLVSAARALLKGRDSWRGFGMWSRKLLLDLMGFNILVCLPFGCVHAVHSAWPQTIYWRIVCVAIVATRREAVALLNSGIHTNVFFAPTSCATMVQTLSGRCSSPDAMLRHRLLPALGRQHLCFKQRTAIGLLLAGLDKMSRRRGIRRDVWMLGPATRSESA
jgi:hypothetical protein